MKKILYFLNLLLVFGSGVMAQNVNIPDPNFKAALIAEGVDTNGDGEIQVSEAQGVTYLNVLNSQIFDLTGVGAFINLDTLYCSGNPLTSLDFSNNINLTFLDCGANNTLTSLDVSNNINLTRLYCNGNLTSLDLSNNINLTFLDCGYNQLSSLDVSNNPNLTHLNCNSNQLTSLYLSNNINLIFLDCSDNQLSSLDVSNNPNLAHLDCQSNQLTILDVSNNVNLTELFCRYNLITNLSVANNTNLSYFSCSGNPLTYLDISNNINLIELSCVANQLTSLDVSNNINLIELDCMTNQLIGLDVSNNINLTFLDCVDNQLTSLDVSNNVNLTELWCFYNQLTSLDFSSNPALEYLECSYNQLTTLDFSDNPALEQLDCSNNQLTSINLKNGNVENMLIFYNNPNLNYICGDLVQLADIQDFVTQSGLVNVFVSTLCTYTPGGNYNTVSGVNQIDTDLNGCTIADPGYFYIPIAINNNGNTHYTCSNQSGNYLAYVDAGSFLFTPQIQNLAYYSATSASIYFPNNNNNVQVQDFCIVPNGIFPDIDISLLPIGPARPGFNSNYQIMYRNKGTTIANGDIIYDFPSNKMNFVSASISPASQTTSQLTWAYSHLQPFEVRTIDITMNILPPPTNNINDIITTVANITLTNDLNLSDNTATLNQTLVGSYDPNDKTCLEGNLLNNSQIGEYLHYMIRFQNTGNYPAEFVVIVDTLDDTKYDLQSLQIIETSHEAHIDLKGKVLQFYFEDIQLADSFSNEAESHGFVVYKLKTKNTLPLNSSVSNKAEIYFDFNPPIVTNVATTTFTNTVGINPPAQQVFRCFPNPAQNTLTIESKTPQNLIILNSIGEVIREISVLDKQEVDISALPEGMYFLKNENGGMSFVKE